MWRIMKTIRIMTTPYSLTIHSIYTIWVYSSHYYSFIQYIQFGYVLRNSNPHVPSTGLTPSTFRAPTHASSFYHQSQLLFSRRRLPIPITIVRRSAPNRRRRHNHHDTTTMTQPPPDRKVAALYTSSTTTQAMVSSEIWAPTG
ncbi:hypothetical protein Hdeb2414_s0011g00361941 [Helianthus debilis subsp. tardiflorus]